MQVPPSAALYLCRSTVHTSCVTPPQTRTAEQSGVGPNGRCRRQRRRVHKTPSLPPRYSPGDNYVEEMGGTQGESPQRSSRGEPEAARRGQRGFGGSIARLAEARGADGFPLPACRKNSAAQIRQAQQRPTGKTVPFFCSKRPADRRQAYADTRVLLRCALDRNFVRCVMGYSEKYDRCAAVECIIQEHVLGWKSYDVRHHPCPPPASPQSIPNLWCCSDIPVPS